MRKQLWLLINLCAVALAYGQQLTPQQLQAALAEGETLTLIDLRPQAAYAKGTLPNAMRMGLRTALEKNITGTVVFFDDGLSVNRARRAVEAFAQAGRSATELVGGYATWRAAGFLTSEKGGVSEQMEPYVTYRDLTGDLLADAADVVLVDVRESDAATENSRSAMTVSITETSAVNGADSTDPSAPIDLASELPGYRITRQPLGDASSQSKTGLATAALSADTVQPLYILIDSGDGKAEQKATELRASGCARVAVLAGGEVIIRRKGAPGLVRRGPGTGLTTNALPTSKNVATISSEVTP